MVRKLSLVVISVLAVVITILASIIYIYLYRKTEALNTSFPWCYNDWKCKAPSDELNVFNTLYPDICKSDSCNAGETYNAIDKGPFSDKLRKKCSAEGKELNDINFVVVNKETGCLCMGGNGHDGVCNVADLEANVIDDCNNHKCGILPRSCGTYKMKTPENEEVALEMASWACDDIGVENINDYCSFKCPATAKDSNVFFNNFIFGLRKS